MRTILFFLFITLTLISCNENKTVNEAPTPNEAPTLYKISGRVITNSYNESVQNLLVTLQSRNLIETYTDSSGDFHFNDIEEGEYQIKVRDNSVIRIDTTVTINSTLNLMLQLNELLSDYLPIKLNSVLKYHFTNYPFGSIEFEYVQEGNLIWKIIEVDEINNVYRIREIVEGSWTNRYPNDLGSPNFGPDTSVTEFKVSDNLWLEVNLSFLEINFDSKTLEIKKYYPKNWGNEVTISNEEWWINYDPRTYIHSFANFHRIRLRKDFGIVYWHCGGISNGAKNFTLTLY